jgi:Pentapeptide repeats (8 copies)
MEQQERPRWWPTSSQVLWAVGSTALAFLIIVVCGYLYEWKWSGLPKKRLWDWLDLLFVPAVLAVGGYLFTRSENKRTQRIADQQRTLDRQIATQQMQTDRYIADQRSQDEALRAYIDQIGNLLLDEHTPLRQSEEGTEVRSLARARTLAVLSQLDGGRKGSVLQFLYESGLLDKDAPVLRLEGADLRRVNLPFHVHLERVSLRKANLQFAKMAGWNELQGADMHGADLRGADLNGADLRKANLSAAQLGGADLRNTQLEGADFISAFL